MRHHGGQVIIYLLHLIELLLTLEKANNYDTHDRKHYDHNYRYWLLKLINKWSANRYRFGDKNNNIGGSCFLTKWKNSLILIDTLEDCSVADLDGATH